MVLGGDALVRYRTLTVMIATAALTLVAAGGAAAQPLGPLGEDKPNPPPQVTGSRLVTAMLPPAAFGDGFRFTSSLNTGSKLLPTRVTVRVPSLRCDAFVLLRTWVSGFGNTAGADENYSNTQPWANYPNTVFYGVEAVLQFATTAAATAAFGQFDAKYAACRSFTSPNPGDSVPGGGNFLVNLMSLSKTTVGRDLAFAATFTVALSEVPGITLYVNALYVVSGTNVYHIFDVSGTNDEPSALVTRLVGQVQALYPHHR